MTGALGADGRSRVTAAIFFGIALTSMGAPQVLLASSGAVYLLAFHGPGMLPAVYVGAALILFPIGWAASIVSRRFSPAGAMVCITVFRAVVALALFIATQMGEGAAVGVLAPIWARVDVILGLVALWRLAGKTFDAADDRKWLMWIAACEPVSSIAAGLFAPLLLRFVDVSAMFLLAAIILAAAAPPLMLIRTELADRAARGRRGGRTRRPAAVRPLSPSMRRYLALVVAAMVLWTVAHYHLDTLFHVELRAAHETPADMFSCFARTLAGAGLVGAGLAALWQGQFLRNHGMRTLLIL